jgi:hypothetical protein
MVKKQFRDVFSKEKKISIVRKEVNELNDLINGFIDKILDIVLSWSAIHWSLLIGSYAISPDYKLIKVNLLQRWLMIAIMVESIFIVIIVFFKWRFIKQKYYKTINSIEEVERLL